MWLPLAPDGARIPTEAEQVQDPKSQCPRGLNVLAVDDDPLVLMTTGAMLEELGCHVFEANSAKQALEILTHNSVHLVLTDQAMPHMTGSQLAEVIRPRYPPLPVNLVTGYADNLRSPAGELPRLGKPFDQNALAQSIATVMDRP